jgi:hypothetical protein
VSPRTCLLEPHDSPGDAFEQRREVLGWTNIPDGHTQKLVARITVVTVAHAAGVPRLYENHEISDLFERRSRAHATQDLEVWLRMAFWQSDWYPSHGGPTQATMVDKPADKETSAEFAPLPAPRSGILFEFFS